MTQNILANKSENQTIVMFDLETTGVRAGDDRVIEIGMLKVQGGKVIDEYNSLVNPGISIPAFITRLTGISDADVLDAPMFASQIKQIDEFIGDALLVAHNAAFDISFLGAEYELAGWERSFSYACSVKLSRRLYPAQRRHGLDHIIARLGVNVENRHRALDDARVIHLFFEQSKLDHSPEQVIKHLADVTLEKHISTKNTPVIDLPEGPGVYVFEDEAGKPLYIGKSINIKKRVQDHLRSDSKFAGSFSSIRTVRTSGELGALLREALMIKTEIPMYNRMLRRTRGMLVLLKQQDSDGYINLHKVEVPEVSVDEFQNFFGVFKSRAQLDNILANLAKNYGLCHKLLGLEKTRGACFASQIGICKGACTGKITPEEYNNMLLQAFAEFSVEDWNWQGPVLLTEGGSETEEDQESFLVDKWCLLGSSKPLLEKFNSSDGIHYRFDFDIYRILRRYARSHELQVKELQSTTDLQLPYYLPARVSRIQGL